MDAEHWPLVRSREAPSRRLPMDDLAWRTFDAAIESQRRLKAPLLFLFLHLLRLDCQPRIESGVSAAIRVKASELARACHTHQKRIKKRLDELKKLNLVEIPKWDKVSGIYNVWIRHAPPAKVDEISDAGQERFEFAKVGSNDPTPPGQMTQPPGSNDPTALGQMTQGPGSNDPTPLGQMTQPPGSNDPTPLTLHPYIRTRTGVRAVVVSVVVAATTDARKKRIGPPVDQDRAITLALWGLKRLFPGKCPPNAWRNILAWAIMADTWFGEECFKRAIVATENAKRDGTINSGDPIRFLGGALIGNLQSLSLVEDLPESKTGQWRFFNGITWPLESVVKKVCPFPPEPDQASSAKMPVSAEPSPRTTPDTKKEFLQRQAKRKEYQPNGNECKTQ